MKVNDQLFNHLAELAKLEFEEKEREAIKEDLNKILGFVGKLDELNTDGVEPLIYLTEETSVLREDIVVQDITQEDALKNAPKKDSDYFKVPKVIEKG